MPTSQLRNIFGVPSVCKVLVIYDFRTQSYILTIVPW